MPEGRVARPLNRNRSSKRGDSDTGCENGGYGPRQSIDSEHAETLQNKACLWRMGGAGKPYRVMALLITGSWSLCACPPIVGCCSVSAKLQKQAINARWKPADIDVMLEGVALFDDCGLVGSEVVYPDGAAL